MDPAHLEAISAHDLVLDLVINPVGASEFVSNVSRALFAGDVRDQNVAKTRVMRISSHLWSEQGPGLRSPYDTGNIATDHEQRRQD